MGRNDTNDGHRLPSVGALMGTLLFCRSSLTHCPLPAAAVEYIFSDKTGTLTCNEMVLKKAIVAPYPPMSAHRERSAGSGKMPNIVFGSGGPVANYRIDGDISKMDWLVSAGEIRLKNQASVGCLEPVGEPVKSSTEFVVAIERKDMLDRRASVESRPEPHLLCMDPTTGSELGWIAASSMGMGALEHMGEYRDLNEQKDDHGIEPAEGCPASKTRRMIECWEEWRTEYEAASASLKAEHSARGMPCGQLRDVWTLLAVCHAAQMNRSDKDEETAKQAEAEAKAEFATAEDQFRQKLEQLKSSDTDEKPHARAVEIKTQMKSLIAEYGKAIQKELDTRFGGEELDSTLQYSAVSPDDKALVEGARDAGFTCLYRDDTVLFTRELGTVKKYDLLAQIPFSSDRARASTLTSWRAPLRVAAEKVTEMLIDLHSEWSLLPSSRPFRGCLCDRQRIFCFSQTMKCQPNIAGTQKTVRACSSRKS